jgi:hypothetical protein
VWNEVVDKYFLTLKEAIYSTPFLAMLYFMNPFVVECDALGTRLRVVLTQEGNLLTFTSKKLCDRNMGKSTYEKEMMAILHIVNS